MAKAASVFLSDGPTLATVEFRSKKFFDVRCAPISSAASDTAVPKMGFRNPRLNFDFDEVCEFH